MRQFDSGFYVAVHHPPWDFVPAYVEGAKFWKELKLAIGEVVVYPIG